MLENYSAHLHYISISPSDYRIETILSSREKFVIVSFQDLVPRYYYSNLLG